MVILEEKMANLEIRQRAMRALILLYIFTLTDIKPSPKYLRTLFGINRRQLYLLIIIVNEYFHILGDLFGDYGSYSWKIEYDKQKNIYFLKK